MIKLDSFRLKTLRMKQGLSLDEVAAKAIITTLYLQELEQHDTSNVSLRRVAYLADVLDVPYYLLIKS